jgi:hypothetical protein
VTGPIWTKSTYNEKFVKACLDLITPTTDEQSVLLYKTIAPNLSIDQNVRQISGILSSTLNEGELGSSFTYTWDLSPLFSSVKCIDAGRRDIL